MCYSIAGRIQTRLASLLSPLLLAVIVVWHTGDQRYLSMVVVMAVVALDLDLLVYPRLIQYQPRSLGYLLAVIEFVVILGVVRWLAGTLPLGAIVAFYGASWLGSFVIINAVLPMLDPMWAEHGGEIGRTSVTTGLRRNPVAAVRDQVMGASGDSLTLAALILFAVLDQIALPATLSPAQAVAAPAAAVGTAALLRLAGRRWPASLPVATWDKALIGGLLIILLLRGPGIVPFLVAGVAVVLIHAFVRVAKHSVVNSAAAVYILMIVAVPGMYSADGQWGNSLLLPLIIANLALLTSLRRGRFGVPAGFGAIVIAQLAFAALGQNVALLVELPSLVPASLIFFGGFVTPDPETTPANRWTQLAFGAGVALLGWGLHAASVGLPYALALLTGNEALVLWTQIAQWRRARAERVILTSPAPLLSRRAFVTGCAAAGGALFLGGSVRQLSRLDPALLSLPADAALAGGRALPQFKDVAGRAGIVLAHHGDRAEGSPAIGTGVAWGDYDGDGNLDLYVTDHMGHSHLYHNNGDGTFTDVAGVAGVAEPGRATSAVFVDYDNDGRPDLYVGVAYGPNRLYRNNGDGTFTDVTEQSGLGNPGRTMSTAWADYDGDGYLDVFVANYTDVPITFDPNTTPGENFRLVETVPRPTNALYHNNGDGTFTDVTHLLGFETTRGLGFSAVWFDYNNDGRPDLYVTYDFGQIVQPNTLWRNDGPGPDGWLFTPVQNQLGVATRANPMGVASGDYTHSGWLDLAVSNIGPNKLYQNRQGRRFVDRAAAAGVTRPDVTVNNALDPSMTWGVSFADLNNDGWQDLYIVAGAMDYENIPQPNLLYLNDHRGGFIDASSQSGTNDPGQGRSVAVGDYNNDGCLDLFVANYGAAPLLYLNESRNGNHWIRLELEGTQSNRDAVGARVVVEARGLPPQIQEVQIGQGLGSCNAKALHFGLATANHVDSVTIRWPTGRKQVITALVVDRTHRIAEPGPSRWT